MKARSGPGWRFFSLLAFFLPLAVFLIGLRYVGSGDTEPAELLPISLIREGNLDFNEFVNPREMLPYWFHNVNGRIVSSYPILPGLLNLPVYLVAQLLGVDLFAHRYILSLISASLISATSVLFFYLALRSLTMGPGRALFLSLVYAFGTCVWSVTSRGMWQHGASLLFLSITLFLVARDSPSTVPLSGVFLSLAVLNRPSNAVIAIPLIVYVLLHRRPCFAAFTLLSLVPVLPHMLYTSVYLGSPLAVGYHNPFPHVANFRGNMAAGLAGLLLSPSRGLLVFGPIFVFSIVGAAVSLRQGRKYPLAPYLATGVVLLITLFSKWSTWWAGHAFGYRYLIETLPALMFFLAIAWDRHTSRRASRRVAFFACLAWSVYVNFLGAMIYPTGFNENVDLETARLWDVRDSELILCTKKLFGWNSLRAEPEIPTVWWSLEKNNDSIPGWLDSPPGGKLVQGPLEISGWAKSVSGDVEVRVVLDKRIAEPQRFPRPDVASVLPQLGDTSRAGFRVTFLPPTEEPSDHRIAVEFRDPAGSVRRLGPIRFRWRN